MNLFIVIYSHTVRVAKFSEEIFIYYMPSHKQCSLCTHEDHLYKRWCRFLHDILTGTNENINYGFRSIDLYRLRFYSKYCWAIIQINLIRFWKRVIRIMSVYVSLEVILFRTVMRYSYSQLYLWKYYHIVSGRQESENSL